MKLKSRIAGSAIALGLALGMSAVPAFSAIPGTLAAQPPTGSEAIYPQGTQSAYGGCTGLLIGTLKATDGNGLGTTNRNITSSSKSYPTVSGGNHGTCLVSGRLGVTGNSVKNVGSAKSKLHSDAADCRSDPTDTAERALTGKFSYVFTDGSKMDAYVRVQGFDQSQATIIWLTGIVAKGEFVGATVGGNVWFNPVAKDTEIIGYFGNDGSYPTRAKSPATALGNTISYAPGYGGGLGGAGLVAAGCLTGAAMTPGITMVAIGAGSTDPLLSALSDGVKFLL